MPLDRWGNLEKADTHARELLALLREILKEIRSSQSYAEYVLHDDDEYRK